MTDRCILNGDVMELSQTGISPLDRGFMYGDGIFDTMFAPKGVPFLFDGHIKRLRDNLNLIDISLPYSDDDMKGMIGSLIRANGLTGTDTSVRTTVTRGVNMRRMFYPSDRPTLFIIARAVPESVSKVKDEGVRCTISDIARVASDPMYRIKSLNFLRYIMGIKAAQAAGVDDCIFFNTDGYVAECTTSNIFVIKGGEVFTPPDDAGLLPGITRDFVIALLEESRFCVQKRNITKDELFRADEVFLTSSVRGIVHVSSIDKATFSDNSVKTIQELYNNAI